MGCGNTILLPKVELIWEPALNQQFTGFPAKIWIFKLFLIMVFAIKVLLNNAYGLLNLLEFICNHFNGLFQAESESEFKNSNFGGKSSEILIQCLFPKKFDFKTKAVEVVGTVSSSARKIWPFWHVDLWIFLCVIILLRCFFGREGDYEMIHPTTRYKMKREIEINGSTEPTYIRNPNPKYENGF